MALVDDDDSGGGIPEWVVTFGDMMSLLLTFFIMLVSLSEIKDEERYQSMVESMTRRFGYDSAMLSLAPGKSKPRNAAIAKVATDGRARRLNLMQGGDKAQAPVGDFSRVRMARQGPRTNIGTVIYFEEGSAELSDKCKQDLQQTVPSFGGKPQKIELRGHTSRRPIPEDTGFHNHWQLAYQRCWNTFRFLTEEQGIDPRRFRISVAGPHEPTHITSDPISQQENPRVEVYLLDETVHDLMGTEEEQNQRFTDGDIP
jgi:chemotaxis protein MotB